MTRNDIRNAAIHAVHTASALCSAVQNDLTDSDTQEKNDRSPVTIADFGAQALVARVLATKTPEFTLVAEEDATELRLPEADAMRARILQYVSVHDPALTDDSLCSAIDYGKGNPSPDTPFWTLDPIDGTKGFLRGDQYAIALGLIENGIVTMGILGCPNLPHTSAEPGAGKGCIFIAEKGAGTVMRTMNSDEEIPIHVDAIASPADAAFCESVESAHTSHSRSARIADILGVTRPPFRIDSQCKYAAVARGDASIYLRLPTKKGYEEKMWDHAAGSCVIEEAGGRVTDITGAPLDFTCGRTLANNSGVVATNGAIHDAVIAAIKATQEDIS